MQVLLVLRQPEEKLEWPNAVHLEEGEYAT